MSPNAVSVFDLSPAEKLQLVENLLGRPGGQSDRGARPRLAKGGVGTAKGQPDEQSGFRAFLG